MTTPEKGYRTLLYSFFRRTQKALKLRLKEAGYQVFDNGNIVIFDEAKNLQIHRINTGLRERLRATRQGLHNTADGRIERRKAE